MEHNGKVFELVEQSLTDFSACGGCAFDKDTDGCIKAGVACFPSRNEGRTVVWAEVQHGD